METNEEEQKRESLPLTLPEGAASIIRQLAAEEIFVDLAKQLYRLPQSPAYGSTTQASEVRSPSDTLRLIREINGLVRQFPGICHRPYEFYLAPKEKRTLFALSLACCFPNADHPAAGLALVETIFKANPDALKQSEPVKGSRPFHYACSFQAPESIVKFLLQQDPDSIQIPRLDGMLPFHLAVYFRSPGSVTDFLLEAWPEAALKCDNGGWSALHAAASSQADLSMVQRLYSLNPDSLTGLDNKGRTPLHLACWQRGGIEVVKYLWQLAPHTLHLEDQTNETCLFRAARSQDLSVLKLLLGDGENGNENNNANDPPPLDDLGATLLHFAALDNRLEVVNYLIDRYPTMVTNQTTDRDQYLPLHTASHFDAPLENIKALVQSNPSTLQTKTGHGETASELATKYGISQQSVEYLQSHELSRKKQKMEPS